MKKYELSMKQLQAFEDYLYEEEKSDLTVEKYRRDCLHFLRFVEGKPIDKRLVLCYKQT